MLHRNMRRRALRPPARILEETVVQISETAPRPNVALGMGAMSPLWPMFAVAATTGAAFWWMSRFTLGSFPTAAVNLEATLEQIPEEPVVEAAAAVVETVADAPVEIVEAVVGTAPEPVVEAVPEPVVEAAPEPALKVAPEPVVVEPASAPVLEAAPKPVRKPKASVAPRAAAKRVSRKAAKA